MISLGINLTNSHGGISESNDWEWLRWLGFIGVVRSYEMFNYSETVCVFFQQAASNVLLLGIWRRLDHVGPKKWNLTYQHTKHFESSWEVNAPTQSHKEIMETTVAHIKKKYYFVGSWIDFRPGSIEWSPCGCSLYFLWLCIFVCRMWNIFVVMVSSKLPWSLCHLVGGLEHFLFSHI